MNTEMLTGKQAEEYLQNCLLNENKGKYKHSLNHRKLGYFKTGDHYTAFDNMANECFVENFETEEQAIKWCESECEDYENFK